MVIKIKKRPNLYLDSFEEYRISVLKRIEWTLIKHFGDLESVSISEIKEKEKEINCYENIDELNPISEEKIIILDDENIDPSVAEKSILGGKIFWEHTAAGEATRLGLGTKYLLNLKRFTIDETIEHIRKEAISDLKKLNLGEKALNEKVLNIYETITKESILTQMGGRPENLLDLSLGSRHMLQLVFDIKKISEKNKQDFKKVLAKQKTLIILNESTAEEIIDQFKRYDFFGLNPKNVYFMIQRSFHGIYLKGDSLFFDTTTDMNKRLHNHGQLMMQKAHDNVIFHIICTKDTIERRYLSSTDFKSLLAQHDNMISYNIEDLNYLRSALDLPSISLALDLGSKNYDMIMEVVSQNPIKPQKGGACFYDNKLKKVVMIESNQLKGLKPEDIKYLNKNFNHYPNPAKSYEIMKKKGLPITFTTKTMFNQNGDPTDYIYPEPVQGDMNFLVNTAYVMRKNLKPIMSWKSPATTPIAVKAMLDQDKQKGFKEFVKEYI